MLYQAHHTVWYFFKTLSHRYKQICKWTSPIKNLPVDWVTEVIWWWHALCTWFYCTVHVLLFFRIPHDNKHINQTQWVVLGGAVVTCTMHIAHFRNLHDVDNRQIDQAQWVVWDGALRRAIYPRQFGGSRVRASSRLYSCSIPLHVCVFQDLKAQWVVLDDALIRAIYPRRCGGQQGESEQQTLLVFGYQCKIFRDDDKASFIERKKHLDPVDGRLFTHDWQVRSTLTTKRFLFDLHKFDFHSNHICFVFTPPNQWRIQDFP